MINPNDETHLARAIKLSREHMRAGHGGPFGSVVVLEDKVVGEGWNAVTSSNDPTAHAEIMAIRRACENLGTFALEGATIYASCEPCPMCLAAIHWARISRVVFANTRHQAASIGFDDAKLYDILNGQGTPSTQNLHRPSPEAEAVFEEWASKADKIRY